MFTVGPAFWGGDVDPSFAQVLALLHFDEGASATSPFVDGSLYSGTQSAASPGLSGTTANVMFGASAAVRANAAGISIVGGSPATTQWKTSKSLPSGAQTNVPITLEGWVLIPGTSSSGSNFFRVTVHNGIGNFVTYVISYRGTGGGGTVEFTGSGSAGGMFTTIETARPSDSLFHHWALCVTPGGNALAFFDGALVGTQACATHASYGLVEIGVGQGNESGTQPLSVYDEYRVTQGIRYAGAFTPAGPFPGG